MESGAQKSCLRSLHSGKNRDIQGLSPGIHGIFMYILIADIVSDPQQPNRPFLHLRLLRSSLFCLKQAKMLCVIIEHYIIIEENFNSFSKKFISFLC